MASSRQPFPPIVVIDHSDAPISPRQRTAWWHVAAALQRLERRRRVQECAPVSEHGGGQQPQPQQPTEEDPTP